MTTLLTSAMMAHRLKHTTAKQWLLTIGIVISLNGCGPQALNTNSLTSGPQRPTVGIATQQPAQSNTTVAIATIAPIGEATVEQPQPTAVVPTQPPVVEVPTSQPTNVLPTVAVAPPPSGEAAWNAQKIDVNPFDAPRTYKSPGSVLLQWYDPSTGQFVGLGWVSAPLVANAEFRLRWSGLRALAIPYKINADYALTLDATLVDRIKKHYSGDTIEAFVWLAPDMVQQ